jgi:hypothetical protein
MGPVPDVDGAFVSTGFGSWVRHSILSDILVRHRHSYRRRHSYRHRHSNLSDVSYRRRHPSTHGAGRE